MSNLKRMSGADSGIRGRGLNVFLFFQGGGIPRGMIVS